MMIVLSFFTLLGVSFSLWTTIGLIRFYTERIKYIFDTNKNPPHSAASWVFIFFAITGLDKLINSAGRLLKKQHLNKFSPKFPNLAEQNGQYRLFSHREIKRGEHIVHTNEVAAIIPAHNEEKTISHTVESLKKIMPAENIYVGSDASTDRTVVIVKNLGAHVYNITPNKGKAGVLMFLLDHFNLRQRYKAIIIIDADSEVNKEYLMKALPFFADPEVAAVAAHASSKWHEHWPPKWSMLFSSYRVRLYRVIQAVMRYGQTWKFSNVTTIIPGFASMYRTRTLEHIKIDAPGLVIEDYNMTFEVQHQRLGKIAYSPQVIGATQDPINLRDYYKQIKRWNLGFWQTIRRHGFWPSTFWLSLLIFIPEMFIYGAYLLVLPLIIIWFIANSFAPMPLPFTMPLLFNSATELKFIDIFVGVFIMDYLITVLVAIYEKKPLLLYYGFSFILFRWLDAFIFIYTIPLAFITKSDGRWVSPTRKSAS